MINDDTLRPGMGACTGCEMAAASAGHIGRREFLSRSALAALATALAACGGGASSAGPTGPGNVSSSTIKISDYPALATVGGVAYVSISGAPIAIVRTSSTSVAAFSRVCPHQGSIVGATQGIFYCPGHGAQFDLNTGAWIGGQRTSSLRAFNATLDQTAGTVTVG